MHTRGDNPKWLRTSISYVDHALQEKISNDQVVPFIFMCFLGQIPCKLNWAYITLKKCVEKRYEKDIFNIYVEKLAK